MTNFIFFQTNKPFISKEIQLFIYKEPNKKNEVKKYIIQTGFDLDEKNLTYTKNGKQEYLEFIEFIPSDSMRISIRLDMNFKIKLVLFRFQSRDLHRIN